MVLIEIAALSLLEKLALVPEAPVPVFPYSWKTASSVFETLVLQTSHPALLMIELKLVSWKQTRAYSLHGRPRKTVPAVAVDEEEVVTVDLLIT